VSKSHTTDKQRAMAHRSIDWKKRFAFCDRAIARRLSEKRKRISDECLGLPEKFFWTTAEFFSMKNHSAQRHSAAAPQPKESEYLSQRRKGRKEKETISIRTRRSSRLGGRISESEMFHESATLRKLRKLSTIVVRST
jgi:hypothetical protein